MQKFTRKLGNAFRFYKMLAVANMRRVVASEPRCFCIACHHSVSAFLPYKGGSAATPALMKAAEVIGSDADHFSCPKCWSHDRERHLLLYFEKLDFKSLIANARVLHFAPELVVRRFIESAVPAEYVRGDLYPVDNDTQRLDLCELPFENGSFDLVIANHVLEHVNDDGLALREIFRVLRHGGTAVLQTPYALGFSKTIDDPEITSPAIRLQLYGQEDHVRLYGNDIFQRFSRSGLESQVKYHQDLLAEIDYRIYGVNFREPLMLFRKP